MMTFKTSQKSITSELLLWRETSTQVSVMDTYEQKVHPISSLFNDGAINFDIPPQPKGMLSNIEVVTTFKIKKGGSNLTAENQCTVVNNFANALWELVEIKVSDRVDIMQSMRNSYAYQTFFDYTLNSDVNREDYLFTEQLFKMDSGTTKDDSEVVVFTGDGVRNKAAADRAKRVAKSKAVTVSSRLHCPLLTTSKALPSNMRIRVSFLKNADKFLLIADDEDYKVEIQDVYLNVTFTRPYDHLLQIIEERLQKQPAPYYVSKPELIIKPIAQSGRIVRLNNLFPAKLPKHAFFCVQRSKDFDGSFDSNPFTFVPFGKFQLYIDGKPYFNDTLEIDHTTENSAKMYHENMVFLKQLYKTIGKDVKGCGLINSKNFQQNFIVGVSFTTDRSSSMVPYLSHQPSTRFRL